jgi:hypothetical protein
MADDGKATSLIPNFYSVEFAMDSLHPVYQFKLWHSDRDALFLLIKDNSKLLSQLKVGTVMPMKYYSNDSHQPTQVRKTQIRQIVSETQGRFQGHYRIELEILEKPPVPMMQQTEDLTVTKQSSRSNG